MEKGMYVKEIKGGSTVRGVFAVAAASKGATREGQTYWALTLSDRSGSIEAKIWAPESRRFALIPTGGLAAIEGSASVFRDKPQIEIRHFEPLGHAAYENADLGDFVAASRRQPQEMLQELLALCWREFRHRPWLDFILSVLGDSDIRNGLLFAPAARSLHQGYSGGLLEHTLGVATLCIAISGLYPALDRQTLLAGAILHDIGKIREYSGGLVNDFTQAGKLQGHIFLGLELISPFLAQSSLPASLQEHLRHLIISHHGELEYGSPKLPQTAEAFALHYADNMDAKLALCDAQFESGTTRPAWSQRIRALERSILLPERTPDDSWEDLPCQENPACCYDDFPDMAECVAGRRGHATEESREYEESPPGDRRHLQADATNGE